MKEFPYQKYRAANRLKQAPASSTFVAKPHDGEGALILKLFSGPSARARLRALETDLCWQRGLVHPHLLGITDAGISGKASFFTTREFCGNGSDSSKFKATHIPQLIDAVCFLHAHNRVHGRVQPSNIFLIDGRVRLADLRLTNSEDFSTCEDVRFTAPEVLAGKTPTIESDYYSVGAILYRLHANRDPFDDSMLENLKAKYLHAKVPSIRNVAGIREPLARAIDGLLDKNPRLRMKAFRDLLRECPLQCSSVQRAPMVGRQETMDLLHSQLAAKTPGTLGVSLIEGDAGTGKSRLIEELAFKSGLYGIGIHSSACLGPAEGKLAPILRLVRAVLRKKCQVRRVGARSLLGTFADSLGPLLESSADHEALWSSDYPNERVVQDLIGLIGAFSRQEPLSLCLEDIDRADPATLGFLRQILYRASELNVRLIVTCRNRFAATKTCEMEAVLARGFHRITLEHLTMAESRELVRYLEIKDGKQAQILTRAGGNPMLLLEYGRSDGGQARAAGIQALIQDEMQGDFSGLVLALALCRVPASAELLSEVSLVDIQSVRQKLLWLRTIGAIQESNQVFEMRLDSLRASLAAKYRTSDKRAMHQALYKRLRTLDGVGEEQLADHALHGCLWRDAAVHFSGLARGAAKRGDNVTALANYEKLKKLFRKIREEVPIEVESEIAVCLARTGNLRKSEKIFQRLMTESRISEDVRIRLSLFSRGDEVDRTHLDQRLTFLREAIESSRCGQLHPSVLLSKLSGTFVTAGDFAGAADALDRSQLLLEKAPDKEGQLSTRGAEGFLLMNRGEFRIASEIYRTLSCESWGVAAAALTNRGVCLEHLGRIRSAVVIQKRAYRLASRAGHLVGQFLCLSNLGVFHAKLGNFKESRAYFAQMKQLMAEFGPTIGISYKGVEAEEATLEMFQGRYHAALQLLHTALGSAALLKSMRFQCLILECEIHSLLGVEIQQSDIERISLEGAWSDSPLFAAQLALLRSRTAGSDAVPVLDEALMKARAASLLYESCRLELEISARLHETDPKAAKPHAERALGIAKKNAYLPLQARALMLRGLCGQHDREREHYLRQSFMLASETGMPELVSESAYHLGVFYQLTNEYTSAREYLAASTTIATEIADELPARFRSKYLSRPWRRDARRRSAEYLQEQPVRLPVAGSAILSRDHRYFRALYRISIAAASAQSVDVFLRELLPAIANEHDTTVVMLNSGDKATWHSLAVDVPVELRQRAHFLAGKHARFNQTERWIPFQGLQYSGGIYSRTRKPRQLAEDEMEFLVILGSFVSGALDQIHNRTTSRPVAAEVTRFHGIVGQSRVIREMCAHIETVSHNNATVLIQGETGTGKELVARAVHQLSPRAAGPFIPVDCGAIPEGLIESELFGSRRGSFTGATADRPGVFEAANGGTLFLDEISNMNLGMQAKLLRVLQEREIRRVGETRNRKVDVRVIAASNTNLKQLAEEGTFRQDLLFRLNVIRVDIPPLRERREDIPLLASHFLNQLNAEHKTHKTFGPEALQPMLACNFPGNIRELRNVIERGFFTASGRTILSLPIESPAAEASTGEVHKWLADLAAGKRNFWTAIHDRYKRRDISREKVIAFIDLGLRTTRGSYKDLVSLLRIERREYRRVMDFLRRNNCLLDFRPYRKISSIT